MDKKIVSLMCKNIENQFVDVNKMVYDDPKNAIDFIHGQYKLALEMYQNQSRFSLGK